MVSLHTSTCTALDMTGEKRAGHDHLSAIVPSYRQTEGALEVPLATPPTQGGPPGHTAQQVWWEG